MKCCCSVMWQELCCDDRLLPADSPRHSQHSIKFRREFRQNSAGAAEGGGGQGGGRGGGSVPPGGGEQRDTRPVAAPSAAAGRQLQSYTSVPRQFTSFSYQTRQAARTRPERARRPPPKCVQRKRAAAARRLDTGAGDCGTYTALTPRVHVISLV